ncbi:MAG: YraN family protein [Pseudomonadota bacterium]|nr:YraN family protein [Pseudomonadota bacterium]
MARGEQRPERERIRRWRLGRRAEWMAALALMVKGYWILSRRYKVKAGEIDLIARRGDVVAIVEVKARTSIEAAMDAVGPFAQRRIEAAADHWLRQRPDYDRLSLRFDIVAVVPRRWPVHIPNAWQARP